MAGDLYVSFNNLVPGLAHELTEPGRPRGSVLVGDILK